MDWIKTTEQLPSNDGSRKDIPCLVVYRGQVEILWWCGHYKSWNDTDNDDHQCDALEVTHWVLLPSPPNALINRLSND